MTKTQLIQYAFGLLLVVVWLGAKALGVHVTGEEYLGLVGAWLSPSLTTLLRRKD